MALKRSFSVRNSRACACLKCGRTLPLDILKDNTVYTCECGQGMFVDRYGSTAILTVCERPELRRRLEHEPKDDRDKEIAKLKAQLAAALKDAKEWQEAADGLARMIEDMKAHTTE